ncbi:MAG: glutamate--tRNA ligase [Bacteroidales bacterium]
MAEREVRLRFAPSPTGPLHIGGVRTALYNFLFAKKHKGKLILRIEDTDQNRYVPGAEQYILESLSWCGIEFDEGILEGGPFGPYRQSERRDIYRNYADQLVGAGKAYYAFDPEEDLVSLRQKLEAEKAPNTSYSAFCRDRMRNSLTMSEAEVKELISAGTAYVIRFKMPANEKIVFNDLIRGEIIVDSSTLDDKVLFKSDGMPTYHLANIVDDHLMNISHVIRGEEWLPSLALHVMLYRAFGWQEPAFAHLPLLLKPDGKGKLSKRDGDRMGFPVFPIEWKNPETGEVGTGYRESGYFREAFINMLALLGWNPGTEQELFSMQELIGAFSMDRVGKSGSRFDPVKARWFNHQYLLKRGNEQLCALFQPQLREKGIERPAHVVMQVIELVKERVDFISEIWDQAWFFFVSPDQYEQTMVQKHWKPESADLLTGFAEKVMNISPFTADVIHGFINDFITEKGIGMGRIMPLLRLSLVGSAMGPGVTNIMEVIGREESVKRILSAIQSIKI